MVEFVTAAEARQHIRVDDGVDDVWFGYAIPAASGAVASWLKDSWRPYQLQVDADGNVVIGTDGRPVVELDDDDNPIVLPQVKLATLVELASQYRFREGEGTNDVDPSAGHGYVLCKGATALLAALRRSTVS